MRPPEVLDLPHDESLLERLAAVPAPVPAADGGVAQALCTLTLVRAWCSSDAALAATARRRLATAHALTAALESGRHPTRRELRAWQYAEGTLQLAMPGLVLAPAERREDAGRSPDRHAALLASVREHATALADLVRSLAAASPRDAARARHLLALGAQHDFAPVLAFSHSAHTVRALFRLLRGSAGVGVLTGVGAEIASGPISRAEALARFALEPSHDGRTGGTVPERDRIWLLLATDLLSEGLNLQHASAVVHLDVPWTAARLEQRVGRVARPGGRRAVVDVYAMSPPASGEALARVETRVRRKLHDASVAIGAPSVGALLSVSPAIVVTPRSEVECVERVRQALDAWRARATERPPAEADGALRHRTPLVAHACAPARGWRGWLACLHEPGSPAFLLAGTSGRATTSACAVSDVLAMSTPDVTGRVSPAVIRAAAGALDEAAREIESWWNASAAARLAGAGDTVRSAAQHRALRRLDQLVADTPRHERSRVADLAAAARTALTRPPSAAGDAWIADCGGEREDARWLRAIASASSQGTPGPQRAAPGDAAAAQAAGAGAEPPVVALLLLVDQRPAVGAAGAAGAAAAAAAAGAAGGEQALAPVAASGATP